MAKKGYKMTQEQRNRLSQIKKKYFKNPENRQANAERWKEWSRTHTNPNLGKKLDREIVEKRRILQLKYYETHETPNKGKKHSQETKDKISETCKRKGVGKWNRGKKRK